MHTAVVFTGATKEVPSSILGSWFFKGVPAFFKEKEGKRGVWDLCGSVLTAVPAQILT